MSTLAELLHQTPEHDTFQTAMPEPEVALAPQWAPWDPERFAEEQIRALVRQVFFPGWPKPARQVVFSAVEQSTYVAEICMRVVEALSADVAGNIGVVEANLQRPELQNVFGSAHCIRDSAPERHVSLRSASQQLSGNLWLVPKEVFLGSNSERLSGSWLRDRVGELRLEFDYTILHGPPAGQCSETALLGQLCDGVVLVLEANSTRRAAAQRVKETLQAANVRLLGAVLSERTFPIPEGIYRKL
jgi:hypothetical protein